MQDVVADTADQIFPDNKKSNFSGRVTRRDFLKLAGAAIESMAEWWLAHNIPLLKELWRENGFLITGNPDGIDEIWSEIPPQLEGKKIPEHNEKFRRADLILIEGINVYREWMDTDLSLPNPLYEKPGNFIDAPSLVVKLGEQLDTLKDRWENDDFYWYVGYGLDAVESYNEPYGMIMDGSSGGIDNLQKMIYLDPGTGFLHSLRQEMKNVYGDEFDVWKANRDSSLSDEQKILINSKFQSWYYSAHEYVTKIRNQSTEPISTSVLFSYFFISQ